MTVVIVKPGYAPYEAEINGLHEMQEVVGGTIQAIYPFADRSAVVCNDEGILLGMPFNRSMPGGYGGVFGPFFVCGLGEEDFCSLTPEQVKAYKKEFHCAEILIGAAGNIIDRCTANIYHDFIKSGGEGRIPTLPDWRNEVKRQPEREAQELALASELFVEGSLNMFAHETNFDIDNRIVCFDLYEMGEQLKPTALNVVLETIQNRVAANRLAGRYTWVFVDEVYLFFKYYYSAQFLYKCWKRFRKYAAAMTAATQNIEECLRSETARLMLANSEFLILLNQAATDRAELAKLLHISETQMSHVTNVEAGHGLMRIGSSIIPFVNEFPRNGALYSLMTTTPNEKF
ncbi:MAG: DUF3846 domain-containing protein [Oscillospiraceae bacterium]|nr:DUF3846 domain-containing protein [Oscillospiraceae bacterium]